MASYRLAGRAIVPLTTFDIICSVSAPPEAKKSLHNLAPEAKMNGVGILEIVL